MIIAPIYSEQVERGGHIFWDGDLYTSVRTDGSAVTVNAERNTSAAKCSMGMEIQMELHGNSIGARTFGEIYELRGWFSCVSKCLVDF